MKAIKRKIQTGGPLVISAKNLGALALPDFCPRCFWLQLKMRHKLPFVFFPGIFSSIDSFTKNVVHAHLDAHAKPPAWLRELGDIVAYREPPHYSKFSMIDARTDITLRGTPDGILMRADGKAVIVDYKTARFTDSQDALHPMYAVQLNVYALIADHLGFPPVVELALVYMEPVTSLERCDGFCHQAGFDIRFEGTVLSMALERDLIPPLLVKARRISASRKPPKGGEECRNCELLNALMEHATAHLITSTPHI